MQTQPQLGVVCTLAQPLHSSWNYFSALSSSILGTYRPGEFILQCSVFLSCHVVHGILKARIPKGFAIPFSSDSCFVRTPTMTCPSWVALHDLAHSFIELHKAVVHVMVWLAFSACGFGPGGCGIIVLASSVCPLVDEDKRLPHKGTGHGGK